MRQISDDNLILSQVEAVAGITRACISNHFAVAPIKSWSNTRWSFAPAGQTHNLVEFLPLVEQLAGMVKQCHTTNGTNLVDKGGVGRV